MSEKNCYYIVEFSFLYYIKWFFFKINLFKHSIAFTTRCQY